MKYLYQEKNERRDDEKTIELVEFLERTLARLSFSFHVVLLVYKAMFYVTGMGVQCQKPKAFSALLVS